MAGPAIIPALFVGAKLATKGFELAKTISAGSGLSIVNIPVACARQANQLYQAIPEAVKQKGTTVFFGQQVNNTPTPGVDPLSVPRGTDNGFKK